MVLALPPGRAREVCPEALADAPEIASSPIVNVHLWYDRPVMDEPFTAVVDSPVQWIFNRTAMGDPFDGSHHLAISISGAREEVTVPRGELAAAMRTELEHLLPAARAARLVATTVVKEPHATFAAGPGQASLRPGTSTPCPASRWRAPGPTPGGRPPWRAPCGAASGPPATRSGPPRGRDIRPGRRG